MIASRVANLIIGSVLMSAICAAQTSSPPPTTSIPFAVATEATAGKSWLNPCMSDPSKKLQKIQSSRIFLVPEATRSEAIALLNADSSILLSDEQARHFLGTDFRTADEIVDKTIADSDTASKAPYGIAAADSVTYARSLYGKLKPYLVRAVAANAGGTIFGVSWLGENLCVFNGSLGPFRYIRRPLLIYLEDKPKQVEIDVASGD